MKIEIKKSDGTVEIVEDKLIYTANSVDSNGKPTVKWPPNLFLLMTTNCVDSSSGTKVTTKLSRTEAEALHGFLSCYFGQKS